MAKHSSEKKIYGSNGIGRNLGKPTKNELHNINARLSHHLARMNELTTQGMAREEASKLAFDEMTRPTK